MQCRRWSARPQPPPEQTGSNKGPAPAVRARGEGRAPGAGADDHSPRLRPPGGLAPTRPLACPIAPTHHPGPCP